MARVLELTCQVKAIGRGDGRTATAATAYRAGTGPKPNHQPNSATAAAAYRAGAVIVCEREGRTHDYSRKQGVEVSSIVLPAGSPTWARDRAKLWNAAELREKNKDKRARSEFKKNAQTAREFMFAYPAELSEAGRLRVAGIAARHLVDTHGIAADFSIHRPGREGDQRNHHCHMLTTTRRMTAQGLGEKAREWDSLKTRSELVKGFRAFIAKTINDELKAEGKAESVFVEHRSFKTRGSPQTPTRHQGPGKTNDARKKQRAARTAWEARQRKEQAERHAQERAALKTRQDFNLQTKLADLERREKDGIRAIRDELAKANAADAAPTGARRTFQRITGQAMRADFERQTRQAQRVDAADRRIAELTAAIRAERTTYVQVQKRDRDALADRHRQEDGQLKRAFDARKEADLATEREARRAEVRGIERGTRP